MRIVGDTVHEASCPECEASLELEKADIRNTVDQSEGAACEFKCIGCGARIMVLQADLPAAWAL